MKVLSALLLSFVLLLLSCDAGLESDENPREFESFYGLAINSDCDDDDDSDCDDMDGAIFSGRETEWNLSSGIVVLGPEETGEPLARLELHLEVNPSDSTSAIISRAILSTTNRRSGTAAELDARLYSGGAPDGSVPDCSGTDYCDVCRISSISAAHITTRGECRFFMELVGGEGPENIRVSAGFTATDAE